MSLAKDIMARDDPAMTPALRAALFGVRFLLLYGIFLLAASEIVSPRLTDTGISVFYVPVALLTFLLFLCRSRESVVRVLITYVAAAFTTTLLMGDPFAASLPYHASDVLEGGLLAYLLKRFGSMSLALRRPYRISIFLLLVVIVSSLSGLVGVLISHLSDNVIASKYSIEDIRVWRDWAFGSMTAHVSILGALLIMRSLFPRLAAHTLRTRWREYGAATLFLLVAVLYDFEVIAIVADRFFGMDFGRTTPSLALVFITMPPVVWLAYSFRQLGAATGIFLTSIPSIHMVAAGYGPLWLQTAPERVLIMQSYIAITAVTALYIAALAHQVKHREFLLKRALWFARKRARDRADFLATFSHELRTPLHGIMGFTQIMMASEGGKLSPRHREFVDMIDQSSRQLLTMVTEVLSLQRMRQDAFALDMEPLKPVDVAQEVIGMVSGIAERESVTIENNIPVNFTLTANERGLRLMLANLISNALLYTPAGGRIELRGGVQADRTWIEIADNGPGFDVSRVLGDAKLSQTGKRKGLGLQVVDTIAALHEGRMSVESRTTGPDTGTCVRLSFPRVGAAGATRLSSLVTEDPANDRMRAFR